MPRITGTRITREITAQLHYSTEASIAAGGQVSLDSPQIIAGRRGRLLGLIVTSSVPFKAEIRTIEAGIPSATLVPWFSLSRGWDWRTPDEELITVTNTGLGLDAFRVVITNLDTSEPADVYTAFVYDEV